ncbi:MAG: hypothetical protein E7E24_14450 [Clostridium perfringens]|nr:hypothetical protein [Clostridium perfringens]
MDVKVERIDSTVKIGDINIPLTIKDEYSTSRLVEILSDISKSYLNLTEHQKNRLKFTSANDFNKYFQQIGIFQKDRTDVWNVTEEYVNLIDKVLKFKRGNIYWLGIEALNYIIDTLIDRRLL